MSSTAVTDFRCDMLSVLKSRGCRCEIYRARHILKGEQNWEIATTSKSPQEIAQVLWIRLFLKNHSSRLWRVQANNGFIMHQLGGTSKVFSYLSDIQLFSPFHLLSLALAAPLAFLRGSWVSNNARVKDLHGPPNDPFKSVETLWCC